MFDKSHGLPSAEQLAARDERWERTHPSRTVESAALLDGLCAAVVAENRAVAAQHARIGELFRYRLSRCSDTESWCVDTMEAVAAEVGAALRISQRGALDKVQTARTMHERLPQVAAVFCAGGIGLAAFHTIASRTDLIEDPEVLARVDEQVAANVGRWPSMTRARISAQVDKIVAKADADAVRQRQKRRHGRTVDIWDGPDGISYLEGTLNTLDAHALDKTLSALAATVCPHDPRTPGERRADALAALSANADRLGCRCGRPDCAAQGRPGMAPVVIHVIAKHATLTGAADSWGAQIGAEGLITPEVIRELAATAKCVPLAHPGYADPEPQYRPSQALADFVRCRDLTCRWPGCDVPAVRCELDHTIPWSQGGPTHAANLKCYCKTHHLVKTFWGWTDQQLPDGTLILTSPDGQTYVTTPGSALLFPSLCGAVGGIPDHASTPDDYCGERTAMMPKRRRTRAQNRAPPRRRRTTRQPRGTHRHHPSRQLDRLERRTRSTRRRPPTLLTVTVCAQRAGVHVRYGTVRLYPDDRADWPQRACARCGFSRAARLRLRGLQ